MLKTAEFQNFTCIPNGTWEFTDGVNVIIGENGLGKSHVLKAVYSMLRVQAEQVESSKSGLEKAYASKLVAVFRPERLGRLVKRKRGRERCEISLHFDNDKLSTGIAFATKCSNAGGANTSCRSVISPISGLFSNSRVGDIMSLVFPILRNVSPRV